MTAEQVNDVLGCGLEQARLLAEAAGGDVGLAVELGMGMLGGGDDSDFGGGAGGGFGDGNNGSTMNTGSASTGTAGIWPDSTLPDSWKNQRLDDFVDGTDRIRQPLNGPCGVLAVVQAQLWLLASDGSKASKPINDRLTAATSSILNRISRQSGKSTLKLKGDNDMSIAQAAGEVRTAVKLVEAAVELADSVTTGQASSLVEGPHWLCSSDLMCLLLRGQVGDGNFGAWNSITQQKQSFYPSDFSPEDCQIGILSIMEKEQGVPVADDLKLGKSIWIAHTGDHFMTMKQCSDITLECWNGLPPEGPAMKLFTLSGDLKMADPAPPKQVDSFRKKRPGQPDDIVQAKKTDSKDYKDWMFEVVPAVDDPTVHGPMDDDTNEPVWSFSSPTDGSSTGTNFPPPLAAGAAWRCASCYATRFQTMNFGLNDAGTTQCSACLKSQAESMHSVWLSFNDLSPRMKRRARQMYAPKLELVIATLYPKAEIAE
mmetsp:Transcript_39799/g.96042  ORF Transcript_39799/g.96042 Transcript_39799/m.96042 type:complete len:484 (+) Transcript_39799:45-1496(+)